MRKVNAELERTARNKYEENNNNKKSKFNIYIVYFTFFTGIFHIIVMEYLSTALDITPFLINKHYEMMLTNFLEFIDLRTKLNFGVC